MRSELPGLIITLIGLVAGFSILAVAEFLALKLLKIAESPKNIIYPIAASILSLIVALAVAGIVVALVGASLIVAMDKGYDRVENWVTFAFLFPLSIPIGIFFVRFLLYLLMKLGKMLNAIVYALVSTLVSVVGVSIIAFLVLAVASVLDLY